MLESLAREIKKERKAPRLERKRSDYHCLLIRPPNRSISRIYKELQNINKTLKEVTK